MTDVPERGRFSLRRWSDRKLAAAREPAPVQAPAADSPAAPPAAQAPAAAQPAEVPALPPVESLTFDADFTAFMKPDVDPSLKRAALKKLFADPRFNVMDGLDVYIDDYSKPDPIDAETVRGLVQARYLFDPPKTRINERGEVEDVPDEAVAEAAAPEVPATPDVIGQAPAPPGVPANDAAPRDETPAAPRDGGDAR